MDEEEEDEYEGQSVEVGAIVTSGWMHAVWIAVG